MRDSERADKLARAIEDIVSGQAPGDLDDKDLNELLQIAKIRLDATRSLAQAGAQYEGSTWQQVLDRLGRSSPEKQDAPAGIPSWLLQDAAHAAASPEELDIQQLQDIISLRRQMAERAVSLAGSHQDAVWSQLQARINSQRRGFVPFWRKTNPEAEAVCSAVDTLILGEPIRNAGDSKLAELLHVAGTRRAAAQTTRLLSRDVQGRVWARLRPRLLSRLLSPRSSGAGGQAAAAWPKLAAAAAALAVVLAALGPLPVTGFADHPVAQLVHFVGEHVGAAETAPPPSLPPATAAVQGTDVTAARASEMLGLPVSEPTFVPAGFQRVASRFFDQALTAAEGGTFLLAYAGTSGTATPAILIYQEGAGGNDIAIQPGAAQDFILPDGTPATYIQGSWRPAVAGSGVAWSSEAAQTLVFDRQGVRTIIQYRGDAELDAYQLLTVAASMAAVR